MADEEALALEDLDEALIEMRKEKVGLCLRVGGDGTDRWWGVEIAQAGESLGGHSVFRRTSSVPPDNGNGPPSHACPKINEDEKLNPCALLASIQPYTVDTIWTRAQEEATV